MKTGIIIFVGLLLLPLAGCKNNDTASAWAGTYVTAPGGVYGNTFNQVVITEGNRTTIAIAADTVLPTEQVFTYATILHCTVQSTSAAAFSETDSVLGFNHPFLLTGTATLNGNVLTFEGTGINAYDTIAYYFYGTKQ
jgi:hypothetical protein